MHCIICYIITCLIMRVADALTGTWRGVTIIYGIQPPKSYKWMRNRMQYGPDEDGRLRKETMMAARRTIYMDHSATTPVREEVLSAMMPYFAEFYGNASSIHSVGRRAGVALSQSRRTIAELVGAKSSEIIFTSGGTEGDNAAVRGLALARRAATGANRIITSPVEHHAVLNTAQDLADHFGFELTLLPVDSEGLSKLDDF